MSHIERDTAAAPMDNQRQSQQALAKYQTESPITSRAFSPARSRTQFGVPPENVSSVAQRLRSTRSCEIVHSSLQEPLSAYKTLEPSNPRWPTKFHRLHLSNGIRVVDQDTVVVSARDIVQKTRKGLAKSSSGTVTYSNSHKMKVELDAEELAKICGDDVPGGERYWTPRRLEWVFKERTGRAGCWNDYEIGIMAFLCLFPKTFEVFANGRFVKLKCKGRGHCLDNVEDAMVRLARARVVGCIEPWAVTNGGSTVALAAGSTIGARDSVVLGVTSASGSQWPSRCKSLPSITNHRLKCAYRPYETKTYEAKDFMG